MSAELYTIDDVRQDMRRLFARLHDLADGVADATQARLMRQDALTVLQMTQQIVDRAEADTVLHAAVEQTAWALGREQRPPTLLDLARAYLATPPGDDWERDTQAALQMFVTLAETVRTQ